MILKSKGAAKLMGDGSAVDPVYHFSACGAARPLALRP
jgi:hypothetical protein